MTIADESIQQRAVITVLAYEANYFLYKEVYVDSGQLFCYAVQPNWSSAAYRHSTLKEALKAFKDMYIGVRND